MYFDTILQRAANMFHQNQDDIFDENLKHHFNLKLDGGAANAFFCYSFINRGMFKAIYKPELLYGDTKTEWGISFNALANPKSFENYDTLESGSLHNDFNFRMINKDFFENGSTLGSFIALGDTLSASRERFENKKFDDYHDTYTVLS